MLAASDKELTRLGVVTIGDKVRLRQLCQRKTEGRDGPNGNDGLNGLSTSSVTSRAQTDSPHAMNDIGKRA